jgi:hypothetical protein
MMGLTKLKIYGKLGEIAHSAAPAKGNKGSTPPLGYSNNIEFPRPSNSEEYQSE